MLNDFLQIIISHWTEEQDTHNGNMATVNTRKNWSTKLATMTSFNEFLTGFSLRIITMHYGAFIEDRYLEQIIAAIGQTQSRWISV